MKWLKNLIGILISKITPYRYYYKLLVFLLLLLILAPLAKSIDSLMYRVSAIEKRDTEVSPMLKEFIEVRQDVKYIKEDINKLDTKVELLINKNL